MFLLKLSKDTVAGQLGFKPLLSNFRARVPAFFPTCPGKEARTPGFLFPWHHELRICPGTVPLPSLSCSFLLRVQRRLPGLTCGTGVDSKEVLDVSVSAAAGGGCLVVRRGAKLWNLTGSEFRSLLVSLCTSPLKHSIEWG